MQGLSQRTARIVVAATEVQCTGAAEATTGIVLLPHEAHTAVAGFGAARRWVPAETATVCSHWSYYTLCYSSNLPVDMTDWQ